MRGVSVSRVWAAVVGAFAAAAVVVAMAACLAAATPQTAWAADNQMYRLYNSYTGEHFYTASAHERDFLKKSLWHDEGVAWTAPGTSSTPVYRLYNPNTGDHHYTTSAHERDMLSSVGWSAEGVGWYSDDGHRVPLYRVYTPNARTGAHHYTTSAAERDQLVLAGWHNEGIGWYAVNGAISGTADSAPTPTPTPTPAPPSVTPQPDTDGSQQTIVYVTRTGEKYHRENCPTLKKSTGIVSMTRTEAESRGLGACKDCRP